MEEIKEIKKVDFLGSFTTWKQCPSEMIPEYAFIGRSNVGKSSLINTLLGRKQVARVSKQPGKTQTLNIFRIEEFEKPPWIITDLPGYGYAKVSQKKRAQWDEMIISYLTKRPQLIVSFVLIDARIPPQAKDLNFINRLGQKKVPFILIFTKIDKVKRSAKASLPKKYFSALKEQWTEMPPYFLTSSESKEGRIELLHYIREMNQQLNEE